MRDQLAVLPDLLAAHLELTLIALAVGTAISVPTGLWAARNRRLEQGALGLASVVQTVPSLALLAFMVPALTLLGGFTATALGVSLPSIGFLPAIIALTLYSVLPVLRNTVTGLAGVDPALVEAARGVGMTPRQRLLRVELPLALPTIVAGLRTAAVWVVGTATLSTPVGAESLGNFIFSGLQTRNTHAVLVGCVAAAGLALALDQLIRLLEIALLRRNRPLRFVALGGLLLLAALPGGMRLADHLADDGGPVLRIGAKTFTEQYILSELLAQHLTARTGLAAHTVQSLGSTVVFDALAAGEIDVYIDYTGTLWATIMKRDTTGVGRQQVLEEVGDYLQAEHGVTMVGPLGFENAYALAMRRDRAQDLGVTTLSELAVVAPQLEIGGDYEFFSRAEWTALEDTYGFAFADERSMDSSLMYEAVAGGAVDVISAFSTDGRIAAFDLALLRDDRAVIPPYDAIILASGQLTNERPAALAALRELVGSLDEAAMQHLNLAVDRDGQTPATVAATLRTQLELEP